MLHQTRSLRLGTCFRSKVLNKSYISHIKYCNINTKKSVFDYEIRLGPVAVNIPIETLKELRSQCSDECIISKTRNCKALHIESKNEDDITIFQSLIHSEFLMHKTTIDAGDKTRFVGGSNYSNLYKLQAKSGAFLYLNFKSGLISIFGRESAVNTAKKLLTEYLNKIIFIELDNKISWICARNHSWINKMKTNYECEIYSEPTGRLVIIAEDHINKKIIQQIHYKLDKAPMDHQILNKKVHQHKLKEKVNSADNIGDVIRIIRNNHHYININNIHSIFHRLRELRQSQMKQEKLMLNINEFDKCEQKLENALVMRRKKNNDYMHFMTKYARKMLNDVTNIVTIAEFMWCFAIFGVKEKNMWPLLVARLLELYQYDDMRAHNQSGKDVNTMNKKLYAIGKGFSAFSLIHPIEYDEYNHHIAILLKELHANIPNLTGTVISYVLDAITNDETFMKLCMNCSFLKDKENSVWIYLGNADNYRNIDNIGHVNVCLILKSLCILYPNFHFMYGLMDDSPHIIDTVFNLCNELFFYHDSMEIEYSIEMLGHLSYLGFYEKTLFEFLLPIDKLSKIDIHDANIYNKSSIHRLLYSFGKTLHITDGEVFMKMGKQLVEYRSTFSFEEYIECVWSVLCIHFLSESKLSQKMIVQLLKTMEGRLADCDVSFISNEMVIKLLQINIIKKILKIGLTLMELSFESMLKDGLQSELLMQYKENEEDGICIWNRNEYNMLILKCINLVLYGNQIESESFLMKNKYELNINIKNKKMQFDHVEVNGLIVNLCVDDRKKRGIMILGPNDVFIDNEQKLCGENYINYHLLTTYFDWDLLCLNWKTHQTEDDITAAIKQWFDQHNKYMSRTALS